MVRHELEGDLFGKKDTREERANKTKEGERSGGWKGDETGPVQGKSSPARDVSRPSNRPINAAKPSLAYNLRGCRFRFTRPIITIDIITQILRETGEGV